MNSHNFKKNKRGFTVAEFAMVFTVFLIVAAGAYKYLPGIYAQYRVSSLMESLSVAVPKIQKAYRNHGNFAQLTTAQVAQNGWIVGSYVIRNDGVPTGALRAPWGEFTIAPATPNTNAQVSLQTAPTAECLQIVESAFDSDMYSIVSINGTQVKTDSSPADYTQIGPLCSASNSNNVSLVFGRI